MAVTVNAVNETPRLKGQATYFGGRLTVFSPTISSVRASPFVHGGSLLLLVGGVQSPVYAHLGPLKGYVLSRINGTPAKQKRAGDECLKVLREARKHVSEGWRFPR